LKLRAFKTDHPRDQSGGRGRCSMSTYSRPAMPASRRSGACRCD